MAETTGIQWCDATFNPWVGCEKVSPGCAHCYAETLVTGRMGRAGTWGAAGTRERTSPGNWQKPHRWERLAQQGLLPDGKTKTDHRPRIFCASLADVFEPRPELELWRRDLFNLIEATPTLDWLILTKRPEHARDWMHAWYDRADAFNVTLAGAPHWAERGFLDWGVLPNIWIGTSIENSRHTWRADVLREIPAAVRFISAEPLLGSLFTVHDDTTTPELAKRSLADLERAVDDYCDDMPAARAPLNLAGIDWLIAGGESGPQARPMHPEWARELRDACLDSYPTADLPLADPSSGEPAGTSEGFPVGLRQTAFLFKQWGEYAPLIGHLPKGATNLYVADGGGPAEPWYSGRHGAFTAWGQEARCSSGPILQKLGKKLAGRQLDDRTWDEFPR